MYKRKISEDKESRLIDADALFKDICDSINEMAKSEFALMENGFGQN